MRNIEDKYSRRIICLYRNWMFLCISVWCVCVYVYGVNSFIRKTLSIRWKMPFAMMPAHWVKIFFLWINLTVCVFYVINEICFLMAQLYNSGKKGLSKMKIQENTWESFLSRIIAQQHTKFKEKGAVINLSFLIVWCKISLFPSINHFLLPEPVHN